MQVREPNIKYLGLENMCRLAEVPAVIDAIHRHHKSIISSLSDPDISIRRRALDLLFAMCNSQNVTDIVGELLQYLDIADLSLREELVLKCALLAERYSVVVPDMLFLLLSHHLHQYHMVTFFVLMVTCTKLKPLKKKNSPGFSYMGTLAFCFNSNFFHPSFPLCAII